MINIRDIWNKIIGSPKPDRIIIEPTIDDKIQLLKWDINRITNPRRYDICQYDPTMTKEDWKCIHDRDYKAAELFKQELLLLEATKILSP